jgi:hypothetical protein
MKDSPIIPISLFIYKLRRFAKVIKLQTNLSTCNYIIMLIVIRIRLRESVIGFRVLPQISVLKGTMLRLLTRRLIKPPTISTSLCLRYRKMASATTPDFVCVSNISFIGFLTYLQHRTRFCTNRWQKLTQKSRILLTRRHGGSSLVWNSSLQRLEYVFFKSRCHFL